MKLKKKLYDSNFRYFFMVFIIILGGFISSIAYNVFIMPHKMLSGGLGGIALIFNYVFGIKPGLMVFILNIPVFILGYKFIDREFILLSLLGTVSFSFCLDYFSYFKYKLFIEDILLASIYGGILNGFGMGIVLRNRASLGGIDIVSVIMKKYFSVNIGSTSLIINFIIVSISSLIYGIKLAMYTLIAMYVSSRVLDKVQEGFDIRKQVMIISDKEEKLGEEIINRLHRGVTYLEGEGAFTRNKKRVIYCIVTLNQLAKLKQIVRETDPNAFMTVNDTVEVLGKGFSKRGV